MFSPLEQFELGLLFKFFLIGIDISFNNISLFLLILILLFYIIFRCTFVYENINLLNSPYQFSFKFLVFFLIEVIQSSLKNSDTKYFLLLSFILCFVLFCNIISMYPYTVAVTGHLVITFVLSFNAFLGFNIIGFVKHGLYMFSILLPKGILFLISCLLVLIEFISYNFRVISLSVRLFANIMAGHTLLLVINTFNFYLVKLGSLNIMYIVITLILVPSIILVILLIFLEFGVALIQAYVFTLLSVMYLSDAKNLH